MKLTPQGEHASWYNGKMLAPMPRMKPNRRPPGELEPSVDRDGISAERRTGRTPPQDRVPSANLTSSPVLRLALRALPLALVIFLLFGASYALGSDRLRDFVLQAGVWAPIVYIALKTGTFVIAPLSGFPLEVAAGLVFGFWDGVVYTVVAEAIGGSINFYIARRWGRRALDRWLGTDSSHRVDDLTVKLGTWRNLVWARIFLTGAYDFVSYAVGLTHISYRTYMAISVLGGIPPTALVVAVGASTNGGERWVTLGLLGSGAVILLGGLAIGLARRSRTIGGA